MNNKPFVRKLKESAKIYPDGLFESKGTANTCVNPFSYHIYRKNRELFDSLDNMYVDGILMCIVIRMVKGVKLPRLSFDMTTMAKELFERLERDQSKNVYFLGTKQATLEKTMKVLMEAYPKMNVAGYRNGYFNSPEEREETIRKIVELNPDYVVVGMGSPLQERFVLDLREAGYKGAAFTCGGFLHQTSGSLNYYPAWVDKYNLRAVYRGFKEKGFFKRYYNMLLQFPLLFIYDTITSIGKS